MLKIFTKISWSIVLIVGSNSIVYCQDRPDNPPLIETPEEQTYSHQVVVDSLEIPWGLDFISENQMLITEKKRGLALC